MTDQEKEEQQIIYETNTDRNEIYPSLVTYSKMQRLNSNPKTDEEFHKSNYVDEFIVSNKLLFNCMRFLRYLVNGNLVGMLLQVRFLELFVLTDIVFRDDKMDFERFRKENLKICITMLQL